MTTGTGDRKKLGFLIVLAVFAAYMVYSNLLSGPSSSPTSRSASKGQSPSASADLDSSSLPGAGTSPVAQSTGPDIRRAAPGSRSTSEEFRPALHPRRREEQVDPRTVDPTLRTDLLAKVQAVQMEGGQRNLFQFGSIQPVEVAKLKGPEPKIALPGTHLMGPMPLPEKKPEQETAKADPPPPPIPYKYYGLSTARIGGKTTAFFLDGDEIILATEGMVVKKRYKVVRIGANAVVMEDVDSKRQQTLNYTEEAQYASGG